ncbi:MAG TPA: protein kinase [Polyangiaceae bacterium]|nr:protein kinase [Polyangiaceae bacterium]
MDDAGLRETSHHDTPPPRAHARASATADTLPADPDATLPEPPHPSATPPAPTSRRLRSLETWSSKRLPTVPPSHYKVTGEVGKGGIGRVLRAHDRRLDRTVAVKELLDAGGDAEERFVREALITARLQHPSIVPIHEAGRWPNGQPFYTMKLVSGRSLGDLIASSRSLDQRLALLPHVLSAAEAIAYAHSKRILHRDLKPANILVGSFGETVVIDWGLAKDLAEAEAPAPLPARQAEEPPAVDCNGDENGGPGARVSAELTMAGTIMGTPAYMPPEQATGLAVDERTDVYALGAILYHVLAGGPPYDGDSALEVLEKSLAGPPEDLGRRQSGVPHDLLTIVRKAMAMASSDRYPSAKELADDLRRFLTGQIVAAHSYSRRERLRRFLRRHRAAISVLGAAIAVLALFATASVHRILAARESAERERDRAERSQVAADVAKRQAVDRADALILMQARAELDRDPNKTLAWLKALSGSFERWPSARLIAADAVSRGLSRVLRGHTGSLNAVAISPDGSTLATASDDRTIRLWDMATGEARVLTGHTDEVWGVRFSPRGDLLASGGKDATTRIWDLKTGASRVLTGHDLGVERLLFSGDGSSLATRDERGGLWLWSVETGAGRRITASSGQSESMALSPDGETIAFDAEKHLVLVSTATGAIKRLPGQTEPAHAIEYLPGGSAIVTGDTVGAMRFWDLKTGSMKKLPGHAGRITEIEVSPDGATLYSTGGDRAVRVTHIASGESRVFTKQGGRLLLLSPDGEQLVTADMDHTTTLWDLTTGSGEALLGFEEPPVEAVFAPGGGALALISQDHTARLWSTARPWRIVARHAGGATRAVFMPDSRRVASVGMDGEVRVSAESGAGASMGSHAGGALDVSVSPDGSLVASAGRDGTARIASLRGGAPIVLRAEGEVRRVVFSPDGRLLATAGADRSARLWDAATGAARAIYEHEGRVESLAFSPDGRLLATGGRDGVVRLFAIETGHPRVFKGHGGAVLVVRFSPDGRAVASGSHDHTIRLWDVETGESRSADAGGQGTRNLVFLPRGEAFVTLDSADSARVWDARTLEVRRWLRGHRGLLTDIAVSPDGSRAVTASRDKTIRLWDLGSGEGRVLGSHEDSVTSVAFSPDGERVVSASDDGTARLWLDDLPLTAPELRAFLDAATPETVDPGALRGPAAGSKPH